MYTLDVNTQLHLAPNLSKRAVQLMRMFGLRMTRLTEQRLHHTCRLMLRDGQICFITGASGSGKSVLLNALYETIAPDNRIRLDDIPLEKDVSLIDCVDGSLWEAANALSKAGFSDLFCMLNSPANLSTGQQWRYRLARAVMSGRQWIFADEFTASLDRITACVIAHHLRKMAAETNRIFILASCHEDMMVDLQPDVVLFKQMSGKARIVYKDPRLGTVSIPAPGACWQ